MEGGSMATRAVWLLEQISQIKKKKGLENFLVIHNEGISYIGLLLLC